MYSTQLGRGPGILGLLNDIRRLVRFEVFDTLSVRVEDVFRMCFANLLVDLEEDRESCATSWLQDPNIVP